jgi:SAM-dependent methyltransferase
MKSKRGEEIRVITRLPKKFGYEISFDPSLSAIERWYVRLLGPPILGLRIRGRYLQPLLETLAFPGGARLADAGSGRGCFAFLLARLFPQAQVTGMDIEEDQIRRNNRIAEALGYTNCSFQKQDVTRLPASAVYDFILSTDNLEHLEKDQKQCTVFYHALKSDGWILFHVPHVTRNLFGWRRPNFMGIEGHVRPGYTLDGLCHMLRGAGFSIERSFYSYGWLETLVNDISYLITGGREKRRWLYAPVFPILLLLSKLGGAPRSQDGSGVVVLARKLN